MNPIVTLTGYLGNDRRIRETQERTYTATLPEIRHRFELAGKVTPDEEPVETGREHDVTIPSREYALLSLATHDSDNGKQTTNWHRLIAWNVDRRELFPVRLARRGDKVRITGRKTSFVATKGKSKGEQIEQIELDRLEILKTKAPEVP